MGASGAGKTSLMNAISDRIAKSNKQVVTGSIMANDSIKLDQNVFGIYATYVM